MHSCLKKYGSGSPLAKCAGEEEGKAAGMSSVAAAGDGSNGAQAQLGDSHGGKAAEQGGVEGIEDVVEGVVDAEQIQEDKGIDASE